MKDQKHFGKHSRARGALNPVLGASGLRDRVIGQYRLHKQVFATFCEGQARVAGVTDKVI